MGKEGSTRARLGARLALSVGVVACVLLTLRETTTGPAAIYGTMLIGAVGLGFWNAVEKHMRVTPPTPENAAPDATPETDTATS